MKILEHRIAGAPVRINIVENPDDLDAFTTFIQANPVVGFDTETTGLDPYRPGFRIRLAQFGNASESFVIPVEKGLRYAYYTLRALEVARRLVIHNTSYDLRVVDRHLGVPLEELYPKSLDSATLSRLVDSRSGKEGGTGHSLEQLTAAYLDREVAEQVKGSMRELAKELKTTKDQVWEAVPLDHEGYLRYAGMDPILTYLISGVLLPRVSAPARHLIDYERDIDRICSAISRQGFLLDAVYTAQTADDLDAEHAQWSHRAAAHAPYPAEFNLASTEQVADVLETMGVTDFETTPTGRRKVDDTLLERLEASGNEFARAVREAKRANKWAKTWFRSFLDNADPDSRCHASINTMQARTARMSITGIPAQTLPSGDALVRNCFIADDGEVIASIDYAAMELRVLAALSGDEVMRAVFAEGGDLHQMTADAAQVSRKVGKMANFLTVYGGGPKALATQADIPREAAKTVIQAFDSTYPKVPRYARTLAEQASSDGYITTITGRRLYVDEARPYSALNYMIQSSSRDVLGRALIRIDKAGLTEHIRLPVHDEVVCSLPEEHAADLAKQIAGLMRMDLHGVDIATDAQIGGHRWGSLYEKG